MTDSDLTADLPAPRDDEPASLRDDIADELRDHLECALRREELKSPGEPWGSAPRSDTHGGAEPRRSLATDGGAEPRRSPAYARVLERFGNPRAVARKLWFDAMREKLMGQRLSLVLQGLMAAAVVVMCFIVYQSLQQSAQTQGMLITLLNKTQQEMLESQRAANAQLVERLAALAQSGGGAPAEWNPLTVQCRFNAEDGPPAAGVKVVLSSASDNTAGIPTTEEISGEDGGVDFGKVLYGQYALTLTAPNGMQRVQDVSIMPGQARHVTIVCPVGPALTTVTPRLVPNPSDPPPATLSGQLWYYVRLRRQNNGFKTWQRHKDDQYIDWLIGPQGQVLDVTPLTSNHIRQYVDQFEDRFMPRSSLPPGPLNEFVVSELLISKSDSLAPLPAPGDETITARFDVSADPGTYAIVGISACLLHPDTSEGMRLLILTPPQRLEGTRYGASMIGSRGQTFDDPPTFTVIHDKPATVDIPLARIRFAEFDRVLKAAPGQVVWRFQGKGLPDFQLRPGWGPAAPGSGSELPARLGIVTPDQSSATVLSGIEVIGWERIDMNSESRSRGRRGGPPQYDITAVLLVTPEERDLLEQHKAKLGIAIDREGTPRSQLTPEVIQELETVPLLADEATTGPATST